MAGAQMHYCTIGSVTPLAILTSPRSAFNHR